MTVVYERLDTEADADQLVAFLAGEVWPFHVFASLTEETVRTRLAEGYYDGESTRSFWIGEDSERVGLIRLEDLDDDAPVFDLRIGAAHRGRGVGGRALQWLTGYVFSEFADVTRIEGTTRQDNEPMRRAFRRGGYVKEAHYREAWPDQDGTLYDSIGYGILRRDWQTGSRTEVRWDDEPNGR
ncbi:hypothetical protein GCM10010430_74000 [Kitasatospora cystarginea]|uniref:N-acetyltransferase domain-containing protein n=1 Tax=Kitasatospora cystarginea TaxID=58350 RepID=A0ABP5RV67_9ACTN